MAYYDHLLNKTYAPEVRDCFQGVRQIYALNGIEIRDYAFPSDFWTFDDNLYQRYFEQEGFYSVDTDVWKPQLLDVMLVLGSLQVTFPTHAGVLVEPNQVFHHYTGRRSEVTAFKGIWRTPALVLRHKDLKMVQTKTEKFDITEFMPDHVKRRFVEGVGGKVRR